MILSFHPCFEADNNIICAGRKPDADDLAAIKAADAVILPQGCFQALYEMASLNCVNVFPDFYTKFHYPGKTGQIKLFKKTGAAHPVTRVFQTTNLPFDPLKGLPKAPPFIYPFVFKFDWGGEGETVYLIKTHKQFLNIMQIAGACESSGQTGFLIQEYIPLQNKTLRVVIIGKKIISYWRIQKKNGEGFYSNLAKGAIIDHDSDPDLQTAARAATHKFCSKTGINLAGFDFLFSLEDKRPLFLEINYFFGRRGLGGSEKFYQILNQEIIKWLNGRQAVTKRNLSNFCVKK